MDLPTYTNIWRIEKRLYKLYDFNLPMPLPMVQIGVFLGVFVPWVVFLQLVRVPFSSPWHVLYLVPPGLVTYLATRPVLEGKRLTELLLAQLRYLVEPRTWCRLTPVYEPERARIAAVVWHRAAHPPTSPARHAAARVRTPGVPSPGHIDRVPPAVAPRPESVPVRPAIAAHRESAPARPAIAAPDALGTRREPAANSGEQPALPPTPPTEAPPRRAPDSPPAARQPPASSDAGLADMPAGRNDGAAAYEQARPEEHAREERARGARAERPPEESQGAAAPVRPDSGVHPHTGGDPHTPAAAPRPEPESRVAGAGEPAAMTRPALRRLSLPRRGPARPRDPAERPATGDPAARIAAPIDGSRRVVVLGCAGGAGQTTTALMIGHALARHRRDRCVAVDANVGPRSLAARSRMETPETLASLLGNIDSVRGYLALRAYTSQAGSGLEVIASDEDAAILTSFGEHDFAAAAGVLGRYYRISLFDPAEPVAPRLLPLADQLVLVTPAGGNAVPAADGTLEWLCRHGHAELASGALLVVNGVTGSGAAAAEREGASAAGRCRRAVRIPRDGRLDPGVAAAGPGDGPGSRIPTELDALHRPTRDAYLELASALVEGFSRIPHDDREEVSR